MRKTKSYQSIFVAAEEGEIIEVVEEEAIEEIIEVTNLIDSMEDLIIKQDKIIIINGICY